MNKSWRIGLGTGVLALVVLSAWMLGRDSRSANSLAKYRAQLAAKGERLTIAELIAARVPSTNDSQAVLTNAVACIGAQRLHPSGLDLRHYTAPGRAQAVWQQDPPNWGNGFGQAPSGTWENFAAEVDSLQQPLADIRQALKNPAPDAGPLTNIWERRVDFVKMRQAAQWLMGAALCEVHRGNLEAGLEDLEALAGLARMERDEYTLVAQMIRVAITGLGTATSWEILQAPGWTEPQLLRLQRAWEGVDLFGGLEHGMVGERAMGEEIWLQAHQPNQRGVLRNLGLKPAGQPSLQALVSDYVLFPVYKFAFLDQDELFRLQIMQESIEAFRLLEKRHTLAEAQARLAPGFARLNKVANSPQKYRYELSLISIPNYTRAVQTTTRNETERQMTIAAVALKRFNLREGRWPANLNELVPAYLAELPYDPMSGKSLCYHTGAGGQFVLYSVGEDGRDDGGDARPGPGGRPGGMWDGRDAVWPIVAPVQLK
ncbi:MAG TPA: hypothetical protein VG167_04975 [Verrucomicrobiae bacterium]|nr:hypothetical protein [Verrucomicrobiae bacterium]